jgi:hypothetical protein
MHGVASTDHVFCSLCSQVMTYIKADAHCALRYPIHACGHSMHVMGCPISKLHASYNGMMRTHHMLASRAPVLTVSPPNNDPAIARYACLQEGSSAANSSAMTHAFGRHGINFTGTIGTNPLNSTDRFLGHLDSHKVCHCQ